jgi:hypothetical protein
MSNPARVRPVRTDGPELIEPEIPPGSQKPRQGQEIVYSSAGPSSRGYKTSNLQLVQPLRKILAIDCIFTALYYRPRRGEHDGAFAHGAQQA